MKNLDDFLEGLDESLDSLAKMNMIDKQVVVNHIMEKLDNVLDVSNHILLPGYIKTAICKNISNKFRKESIKLYALTHWLKDNDFVKGKEFEYGHGDREVCYLGRYDDKDVILLKTQNIEMVAVLVDIEKIGKPEIHIRKVYPKIEEDYNYGWYSHCEKPAKDLNEFKQYLKEEEGLEFAIVNLTSPYNNTKYSDSYPSNKHPHRISLENMIDNKFSKGSPAFRYLDDRDKNYIYSMSFMFNDKSFIYNIEERDYSLTEFFDLLNSPNLPDGWFKKYYRDNKIKEILE